MNPKEFFRRLTFAIDRKLNGPSITDRDFPDNRPTNLSRDKFAAAKIIAGIDSLAKALTTIQTHQGLSISDYNHRREFHQKIVSEAIKIAQEKGAENGQIGQAIEKGNELGSMLNQGFDDYHF